MSDQQTDWDSYYLRPASPARFSRRLTARLLERLIRLYCKVPQQILELGGGNSCFMEGLRRTFRPARYCVVDNNRFGLELFAKRWGQDPGVCWEQQDVRELQLPQSFDLVFSVGLIEHFSPPDTRRVIQAHFRALRPGGIVILSFPTPTWLYRCARWTSEAMGLWNFPDERPLGRPEVAAAAEQGEILFETINWPILFTQMVLVLRQRA